jgi:hypothetical protein
VACFDPRTSLVSLAGHGRRRDRPLTAPKRPISQTTAFLALFFVVFANFAVIVNKAVSPCIRTKVPSVFHRDHRDHRGAAVGMCRAPTDSHDEPDSHAQGLQRRQALGRFDAHDGCAAVHLLDQARQHRTRTELDERIDALAQQPFDDVLPADR